jgi:tRNA (guanine-N7-)-methyltransferase
MPDEEPQQHRHILTFNFRQGRNKPRHDEAFARLWPRYGAEWEPEDGRIVFAKLFGRTAPVILEIGSGNGEAAAAMCDADRDRDLLAVEVYPQGIADLMARAEERGLDNLRVYQGDALPLMWHGIAPESLDEIRVYFPDPWPKKRHHKRRIIQTEHVRTMAGLLRPGGVIHCATDIADYAEQMLEVLTAEPAFVNTAEGYAPRPDRRPMTKFERRGVKDGRPIADLVFRKR